MYREILSVEQVKLLSIVKQFKREFYLVGGTAIALQIGHRRSIDFDLFKNKPIRPKTILSKISESGFSCTVTRRVTEQLNVNISDVKFTFYEYPFRIEAPVDFESNLRMPELLDLAAMKAYALGRRSKWKDYVDLYFLLRDHFSIDQISDRANQIFDQLFSPKLFRAQISYFDDINYDEPIEFILPVPSEKEIKQLLIDKALDISL
ncbi:MAG: nucleotidyl transferase AbiEii/AbiGii toxin family protein [Draconibacterium sp.]|nr:nucleotidyl transferase AbiEii/AbiGii toxin family protein [Draconibacterium sp.]